MARLAGSWSKDPSTGTGCVIANGNKIVSVGFNGYPHGVNDTTSDSRDVKLDKTIHAEINAILHAGHSLAGCTLYVTPIQPCSLCAAVIIQAGIRRVVTALKPGLDITRWESLSRQGELMFIEAGVRVDTLIVE